MFIIIQFFFLLLSSTLKAAPLESYPSTGIKITEPGIASGAGTPMYQNQNSDPRYPYWNNHCQSVSSRPGDALCWPDNPTSMVTLPAGTAKFYLNIVVADGYGNGKGKIVDSKGKTYSSNLHMYDTANGRYYRLQFYSSNVAIESYNCGRAARILTRLPYEGDAKVVYSIDVPDRNSSCNYTFTLDPSATDTRVSMSLGSVQARYDNNIYSRLPSGDWVMTSDWSDRAGYHAFDINGKYLTNNGSFFDSVRIKFNIFLDTHLRMKLLSPVTQELYFNPEKEKAKSFVFNSQIDTNANKFSLMITCKYKVDGRCALKNDEGVLLPLDVAYRDDYLTGPSYVDYLAIDKNHMFSGAEGRYLPIGLSFILSQADVLRVQNENVLASRRFEGGATVILESVF